MQEFSPEGWMRFYLRTAELLRRDPRVKGLIGTSWLYDPALADVSPHLAYLRTVQIPGRSPVLHGTMRCPRHSRCDSEVGDPPPTVRTGQVHTGGPPDSLAQRGSRRHGPIRDRTSTSTMVSRRICPSATSPATRGATDRQPGVPADSSDSLASVTPGETRALPSSPDSRDLLHGGSLRARNRAGRPEHGETADGGPTCQVSAPRRCPCRRIR